MLKHAFATILLLCLWAWLPAQSLEEMTQLKQAQEAVLKERSARHDALTHEIDSLKASIADLTDKITPYPRWSLGLDGTVGFNFASYRDWYSKAEKSTDAFNLGFALTGFANLDQRKWFWRNKANVALGWLKFDNKDVPDDDDRFRIGSDVFNLQSLYGYKINKSLAASALADYRTALLEGRFNNPGFLDIGVGVTWTPIKDLVAVFHPLNYNFVFSRDTFNYQSSTGCKIVVDYHRDLGKNLHWKSNLSAFVSYQGSDLSNWTWTNGVTTAVKGIGVGFDFALRQNKQEALALDPGRSDNPLQTYFILGLTYAIKTKA